MSDINKVVARFTDGTTLKGTTQDFFPNRPFFHMQPLGGGVGVQVQSRRLKAVFFVRDLGGDPHRQDVRGFIAGPGENAQGRKIAVRFKDGEMLCGYTLSYTPDRDGFFVLPADTQGNNIRVYVVRAACQEVKCGEMADALARKSLDSAA